MLGASLQRGFCAIHLASYAGHLDIVRFIAERAAEQLTAADSVGACLACAGGVWAALP